MSLFDNSEQLWQLNIDKSIQEQQKIPYQITRFAASIIRPKRLTSHPFYAYTIYRKKFQIQNHQQDFQDIFTKQKLNKTNPGFNKRTPASSTRQAATHRQKFRTFFEHNPQTIYDRNEQNESELKISRLLEPKQLNNLVDFPKVNSNNQSRSSSVSPNFPFNLNFLVSEIKKKRQVKAYSSEPRPLTKKMSTVNERQKMKNVLLAQKFEEDRKENNLIQELQKYQQRETKQQILKFKVKDYSNQEKLKMYNQSLVQKQILMEEKQRERVGLDFQLQLLNQYENQQ